MKDRMSFLHDELSHKASQQTGFNAITDVAAILDSIPDRTAFLNTLLKTARRCFMSDHEAILSYHKPTRRWFVEAAQDLKENAIDEINGLSRTVIERTRDSAVSVLISDTNANELTRDSRSVQLYNIQSVLTAPIQMGEDLWGLIYLANTIVPGTFDLESQRQIETFARFAGIAIKRCDEFVGLNLPPLTRSKGSASLLADVRSPKMMRVIEDIKLVAPTDASVLLLGESGTGKNLLARWIHEHSQRRAKPFVEINCVELDTNLIALELFGVESGVATGVTFREGKIKVADGGTVFINEIGDLPLSVQAKLLRVVEEKVVERVGGRTVLGVDVRFLCATHQDLPVLVEAGQFRSDLFHRINVFEVTVPPLRDRMEDLPKLVRDILPSICKRLNRPIPRISQAVLNDLAARAWKGNIRELAYVLERAIIRSQGDELEIDDQGLGAPAKKEPAKTMKSLSLKVAVEDFESAHIRHALHSQGWVVVRAAKRLGIPMSTLRSKMIKYGIEPPPRLR